MRFLVDECCARLIATVVRELGYDVTYVPDIQPGVSDDVLLVTAVAEARVVITQDYDFGELAVRQGVPQSGVLLVACPALTPTERADRVVQVVKSEGAALEGRLTIVERKRLRHRSIAGR